jgi:CspA family cold shock protein
MRHAEALAPFLFAVVDVDLARRPSRQISLAQRINAVSSRITALFVGIAALAVISSPNPQMAADAAGITMPTRIADRSCGLISAAGTTVGAPKSLAGKPPIRIISAGSSVGRSTMARGTVKWFNPTKGYGFIQPQGGGRDVFVHISAVERAGLSTLNEGQQIEYEIEENRGKTSAVNLKVK